MNDGESKPRHNGRASTNAILLASLARGATIAEAAANAGVSPSTVVRRQADPEFAKELALAREKVLEQALDVLATTSVSACRVLAELLNASSENVQLGAARAVLENVLKVREYLVLTKRLDELRERLEVLSKPSESHWSN